MFYVTAVPEGDIYRYIATAERPRFAEIAPIRGKYAHENEQIARKVAAWFSRIWKSGGNFPDEIIVAEETPYFVYRSAKWGYGGCTRVYSEDGSSIAIFGQMGDYQSMCRGTNAPAEEIAELIEKNLVVFGNRDCCGMEALRKSRYVLPA